MIHNAAPQTELPFFGLLAQASGSSDKNAENEEHHSRMSKAAFWKHHKHQNKTAKLSPAAAQKAQKQKAQARPAEIKPVSAKKSTGTKNELKVPYRQGQQGIGEHGRCQEGQHIEEAEQRTDVFVYAVEH